MCIFQFYNYYLSQEFLANFIQYKNIIDLVWITPYSPSRDVEGNGKLVRYLKNKANAAPATVIIESSIR